MLSGAFIHGDNGEWVKKMQLALLTAARGKLAEFTFGACARVRSEDRDSSVTRSKVMTVRCGRCNRSNQGGKSVFYPFHLLVKRLIHTDFKGTHVGVHSFLRTLVA